ncbi:hypothetical protein, variant 1 [Aphanomyces invadans]|uniref:Uncharacterized protein n=1 Tax=Aphanomyces invadans TaxID=157072 RepID=A0A024TE59_9STRA|nr:hypothetical protein, variant 1 [Aphanomyces invadans]ETV91866.1 hypothetical protein, variant 1 [Aphanomyces invadans]|eukprot:XP_008879516.1 hypothetical protein, variant 1 [Aphanomyces invadans]
MGGRLSFLRRKRAKQAVVEQPVEAPVVVEEPPPPPPPEVFDSATFWDALKGILRFRRGDYSTPLDKATLRVVDATKVSGDETEEVKRVSKALGDRFIASDDAVLALKGHDVAMEHFSYALSLLALGNTTAACNEFANAITKDPSFGRAYTHLAHTLVLDTQDDTATLERVVGCLESALKYDDTEVRENMVPCMRLVLIAPKAECSSWLAKILLAEVYSLLGNHAAALDVYGRLVRLLHPRRQLFSKNTLRFDAGQRGARMGKCVSHGPLRMGTGTV